MVDSVQSAGPSLASASARTRAPASAAQPRRVPHLCGLSFVTYLVDSRDRMLGDVHWFDVPEEKYDAGCRTGERAFIEMMAAIKASGSSLFPFDIIQAAVLEFERTEATRMSDAPCRRGAAVGFLRAVEAAVVQMARAMDVEGYRERVEARYAARDMAEQAKREALVRRLAEGRARKAAERQQ